VKDIGPLQGAVNFAIVNGIGGYFVVIGIALAYARTGALNLAQIGHTLAAGGSRGLVVVAMTLVVCGFLCKAAVVPFHLWLADAYAVAPSPVCAVFAGVMTDIGLLGVARVYWTVFDGSFVADRAAVGDVLISLGVATALLGGAMAFLQRHVKRMIAYSVVCHVGIMLAGIGLLTSKGLAGAADVLLAHGLLAAGLFLTTGIVRAGVRGSPRCGSPPRSASPGRRTSGSTSGTRSSTTRPRRRAEHGCRLCCGSPARSRARRSCGPARASSSVSVRIAIACSLRR
jgi:multicomponent Na+:H+ antiporter subunit D